MSPLFASALTGFFVFSGVGGMSSTSLMTDKEVPVEPTYQAVESYTVSMTGYNAVPEQTDDTPFSTSIGAYTNPEIIVARSSDLGAKLPYGTVIRVSQIAPASGCEYELVEDLIGYRVVADAMHPRWRNKIDILFDTRPVVTRRGGEQLNAARALGYCKNNIKLEVVGKIDTKKMPKSQTELKEMLGLAALAAK
jgi:3D (Asp-Asp-Asp) domain-containing protein